jgi:tRNA nucleotidyltransferase/poly(A) polymerase
VEKFQLPAAVETCCGVLRGAGYAAHPVGGCVRDLLLGRTPQDWDVTTSARPERVGALFPRALPTGLAHGTVTVVVDSLPIQVTTFRREEGYSDARHPDAVRFDVDLAGDLARRDFTVNAMALGPEGEVIDPFDGQGDLARGLLRAVGDPAARFSEDALRILRAVRFAAQLSFALEEGTAAALAPCAPLVDRVAPERVKAEVEKILLSPRPQWVGRLVELGVLDRFFTGWRRPCPWDALARAERAPIPRWRAFCALTGFPIAALPVERAVRMAVLHPEREAIKQLALTGGDLYRLGLRGEEIGAAQRGLARHVLAHPEDNTKARLGRALETIRKEGA